MAKPLFRPSSIEGLGWEYTPGAVKKAAGVAGKKITYKINAHGFRDESEGAWRPWQPSDLKIAIIGDSVTAGAQADYTETYSAQLEAILKQLGTPARVANFGVDATNTRQQLALMKARVLALKPDVILLAYFMNDIEKSGLEHLPKPARELLRHWHLAAFLSQRVVQTVRNRKETSRYQHDLHPEAVNQNTCSGYIAETLQAYQTTKWAEPAHWIQEMQELCRKNAITFGVLIFPFEPQIRGICPLQAQSEIALFLSQAGIPFLDIAESFRKIPSDGFYIPGDPVHLSAAGHRGAAVSIKEWLSGQGILQLKMKQ
jgi:lysophospholipase L1-like esterase